VLNSTSRQPVELFCKTHAIPLIFGTPYWDGAHYYNSAVALSPTGNAPTIYKKNHLMPFGEYIPGSPLLKWLHLGFLLPEAEYSASNQSTLLACGKTAVGTGICLESIYPWTYRQFTQKGATLLANLSNTAWFLTSSASEELLQMSVMRAVENGRYFIQVANTGISAIIDSKGRFLAKTNLNKQTVLTKTVSLLRQKTVYTRFGNVIVMVSGMIILWGVWRKLN